MRVIVDYPEKYSIKIAPPFWEGLFLLNIPDPRSPIPDLRLKIDIIDYMIDNYFLNLA
jgi:hypothetical protein